VTAGLTVARLRVPLGFVAAAIYIWRARPTPLSLSLGLPIAALGLLLRAAASGHIRKNDVLATTGPYRYTRNPLYLGSAILALGLVIAAADWLIALIAVAMFLGVYLPVIRREEDFLRSRFGTEFDDYARAVPRLFPRFTRYGTKLSGATSFSWQLFRRHREYNAWVGAAAITLVLIVKLIVQGK
jgi:protein-S-isoprenylcysteine O-methyltransferase Ste14